MRPELATGQENRSESGALRASQPFGNHMGAYGTDHRSEIAAIAAHASSNQIAGGAASIMASVETTTFFTDPIAKR